MSSSRREPDPRLQVFGFRVRAHRAHLGLSQLDLSTQLGKVRTSIANLEAGQQNPPLTLALDIAAALGTNLATLAGDIPDPVADEMTNALEELEEFEAAALKAQAALQVAKRRARTMGMNR